MYIVIKCIIKKCSECVIRELTEQVLARKFTKKKTQERPTERLCERFSGHKNKFTRYIVPSACVYVYYLCVTHLYVTLERAIYRMV